jgi:hypothetical protein
MSDSKLKARDIIAGWPRGRSTSTSSYYLYEAEMLIFVLFGRTSWNATDLFKAEDEISASAAYHREQQRMFDWYVSRYRAPKSEMMIDCCGRKLNVIAPRNGFVLEGMDSSWRMELCWQQVSSE